MEDPTVAECEVGERAAGDRQEIGGQVGDVEVAYKQAHERDVGGQGDEAGGEIEAQEAEGGAVARAVAPRPAAVPEEIVQHGGFDGQRGRERVVQARGFHREREDGQLHGEPGGADGVEAPQSRPEAHGRRSAR
ncbi:MAG TPA: hypothetical protein VN442_26720 [Bryobacteraceae bacterium]|nr:hypothetical protein [Bryobacteraceae bacterium]